MIQCDLTDWPLAVTRACGPAAPAEHTRLLTEWTGWLDRGERFAALLVLAGDEALPYPDEVMSQFRAWQRAHAERVRRQVLGIAIVATAGHFDRIVRADAGQPWGVPAEVFVDIGPALNFLGWFIASPSGTAWDSAGIRARMCSALNERMTHRK